MKIILFGHQNWGIEAIRTLNGTNHELAYVYTHPIDMDKNEKVWYDSLSLECKKAGIPYEEKKSLNENDIKKIQELNPDLILSMGWRRLLPSSIFKIPKFGTINFHDGLIPKYKGFAPINWSIINGENETGLTSHYIDASADTGDIIHQERISISNNETAFDVYKKLLKFTQPMLKNILQDIKENKINSISQKTLHSGFFCSRRFPDDGKIDWTQNRIRIYNLVRALCDPYPNSFFYLDDTKIYVKKAKLSEDDFRGPPGRLCTISDDGIIVTCGKNHQENQSLLITEIQVNNKILHPKDFFKNLWIDLS
jgi:methionyl-tRNA formyltransferase